MAAIGTKRGQEWEVSEMEEGKGVSVYGIPVIHVSCKGEQQNAGCALF